MSYRSSLSLRHALAVSLLATACSSPSTEGAADAGVVETLTPSNYVAKVDAASCEFVKQCDPKDAYHVCRQTMADLHPYDLAKEVAAGRLAFDATRAQACLDAFVATPCPADVLGAWHAALDLCESLFVGQSAPGGGCFDEAECAGDAFCDVAPGANCPGKCIARRALGEACQGDHYLGGVEPELCQRGLACHASTRKCVAFAKAGEDCADVRCADGLACDDTKKCVAPPAPQQAGATCGGLITCATGLYCNAPDDAPRVCTALPTEGQPCDAFGCAAGLWCRMEQVAGPGTCAKPLAEGDSCAPNLGSLYVYSGCPPHLECAGLYAGGSGPGTCRRWANVGEACVPGVIHSGCMYNLECGSDGKCLAPPTSGKCRDAGDVVGRRCALYHYCDRFSQNCFALKAGGTPCRESEECESGWCGEDDRCLAACRAP